MRTNLIVDFRSRNGFPLTTTRRLDGFKIYYKSPVHIHRLQINHLVQPRNSCSECTYFKDHPTMQSHVTYNLLKPQNENNQLPCTSRKFAIIAEFVHFFFLIMVTILQISIVMKPLQCNTLYVEHIIYTHTNFTFTGGCGPCCSNALISAPILCN